MHASLIVPLTGAPAQALRCLRALATLPEVPDHEVVVVDDASVGLDELFGMLGGDVELVRLERRAGLSAAVAAALPHCSGDHVVLLRDAAEVDPGWLAPLVAALEQDAGLAGAASASAGSTQPPVGAHALAWRRTALAEVPSAPDGLAVAALCAALARTGEVRTVAASVVHPPGARGAAGRAHLGADPELSVVIPTLDATSDRLRRCVAAIQGATDVPHEIVVVDNGAPPQGFTAPVNSGLRAARGRYAVVCNDDVEVLPGWWSPLREALDAGAPVAFPLTVDGAMRTDFAAWCFAVSRATLERHSVAPGEFLHPELVVWYQDTDLLHRLRAAGTPPQLVESSRIRHGLSETVASTDPALRAWIDEQVLRDKERFEQLHGPDVSGAAR